MRTDVARRWFRSSLSQQLVVATVLAVLPLVLAVGYATWSLAQQTRLQHKLVQSMASLNRLDASVSEQVKDLERLARQFGLMNEPRFHQLYMQRLDQLRQSQSRLEAIAAENATDSGEQASLAALVHTLVSIGEKLQDDHRVELAPDWQRVYGLAAHLSEQIDAHLHGALAEGESQFDAIVGRLLIIGVLAVPGTVLLVVIGCITIYRPIRRLSEAIRQLGHRQWERPVSVGGPADLIELGERLEWMRRELLAAEQQKQVFLRHITHELNSPLSAIMEAGALLADKVPGELNDAQMKVLKILQGNANSLRDLIRQLLNYNSVTHGIERNAQLVDIEQTCARLAARFDGLADENNITWRLRGDRNTVLADPLALEMILSNLFSNAFYFSPPDSQITVEWDVESDRWWLAVADQGPGIQWEEQQDIFRPFYQGRNKRRGSLKGSGVGLAIVDECTRALGGLVRIESEPQKGSRFWLEFPIRGRDT